MDAIEQTQSNEHASAMADELSATKAQLSAYKQLLLQLAEPYCAQSAELKPQLDNLCTQLQANPAPALLSLQCEQLKAPLDKHKKAMKAQVGSNHSLYRNALKALSARSGLSEELQLSIAQLQAQSAPRDLSQLQLHLSMLLGFYQQALQQVQTQHASNLATNHVQCQDLCDELQRLISAFHYEGEIGEAMHAIHVELLGEVNHSRLPQLCLEVIKLIIRGNRQERKNSREFLFTLSDSLGGLQQNLGNSLNESVELNKAIHLQDRQLKAKLISMNQTLRHSTSFVSLKENIQEQLLDLGDELKEKERLSEENQRLLTRLNRLEQQLKTLSDDSQNYKQKLISQQHKLFVDTLTQIQNRAGLDDRLESEFKHWQRYKYQLAIAIVDIDHFKSVNVNYGHLAGDKVLKVVAQTFENKLKDNGYVARLGGEEFVVLLPNTSPSALKNTLEGLQKHIAALPFSFKGEGFSISVSIGASLFQQNDSASSAFERAELALYRAKAEKTNTLSIIE